ncbi:MAG: hypothetical protein IJU91_03800 [Selenomonadaceae bacterium]|nr:hypothetical protein [Selenomonadaceae bacterium]
MNVAIFGVEEVSQLIAQIINQHYNSWLKQRMAEPLNVVAHVVGGGLYRQISVQLVTPRF